MVRINPIRPQVIPVAWGLFCTFGFGLGIQKLFEFPYLSPGWQGGIGLMVMAVASFLAIEGWWFASQREIRVSERQVQFRTWLQTLVRRPGIVIAWGDIQSAGLVIHQGRKLALDTPRRSFRFWTALWDPAELRRFIDELRVRGVPTRLDWVPDAWSEDSG